MKPRLYKVKSGKYLGLWHARVYLGMVNNQTKYFHIGRFRTKKDALKAIKDSIKEEVSNGSIG